MGRNPTARRARQRAQRGLQRRSPVCHRAAVWQHPHAPTADLRDAQPTCLAYTSYLLANVYGGSFPDALGAVLPCYWIYQQVGAELGGLGSPDPLYQRWIDTYGGEDFAAVVHAVIELTDRLGPELSASETSRMAEHFRTTSRYEWMFWEMGWQRQQWPI